MTVKERIEKSIILLAAVCAIFAAIAAISGFSIFEKLSLFPGNGGSSVDSSSAPSRPKEATISQERDNQTMQACGNLAKQAADDVAQGFLLSAERAQKMRLDMQCGPGKLP